MSKIKDLPTFPISVMACATADQPIYTVPRYGVADRATMTLLCHACPDDENEETDLVGWVDRAGDAVWPTHAICKVCGNDGKVEWELEGPYLPEY